MNALSPTCRLADPSPPRVTAYRAIAPASDICRSTLHAALIGMLFCVVVGLATSATFAQGSGESSPSPSYPDSGYESGGFDNEMGSAPAKPSANLTVGPTPISMFQLIQPDWKPLRQEIVRILAPSITPAKPPVVGPLLRNEANVAFRYGNVALARELYFGFLAHGSLESKEDLDSLKFSTYFRRPAWQLRWGVSLGLHGDTTITAFAPIRADSDPAAGGMGGMDSSMEMSTSFGSPSSSSSPGSSAPFDDMESMQNDNSRMGMGMGMGMDGGPGPDGPLRYDTRGRLIDPNRVSAAAPLAQMTDPAIRARFEELMGYVATTVNEGMTTRMASGQFGPAFAQVDPDATDQGDTVDGDYVQPGEPRMWIPNVIYLGEGSTQEMSKAAAKQEVELLLHFDVALKEIRNSTPQNSSRVKVIDGRTGRTLITSTEMDNRELQRLLQTKRGTAESYVNEALEKFWGILDSKLSVQPFPQLTPEIARRRVTGVLAEPTFSLLRKLAEIRYMGVQGWLTEDEVEEAYSIAAGTEGMTILYGSQSEAVSVIHEIAKRSAVKKP